MGGDPGGEEPPGSGGGIAWASVPDHQPDVAVGNRLVGRVPEFDDRGELEDDLPPVRSAHAGLFLPPEQEGSLVDHRQGFHPAHGSSLETSRVAGRDAVGVCVVDDVGGQGTQVGPGEGGGRTVGGFQGLENPSAAFLPPGEDDRLPGEGSGAGVDLGRLRQHGVQISGELFRSALPALCHPEVQIPPVTGLEATGFAVRVDVGGVTEAFGDPLALEVRAQPVGGPA